MSTTVPPLSSREKAGNTQSFPTCCDQLKLVVARATVVFASICVGAVAGSYIGTIIPVPFASIVGAGLGGIAGGVIGLCVMPVIGTAILIR